ncbi:MAG: hypothetical protein EBR34_08330 [Sphingomonadaceae bacterium]|nr:hypothetical protein [Sphingomonadaceae bacterium]
MARLQVPMPEFDISRIFHPALIDCMANARAPTPAEIETLAEQIWSDMHGSRAPVAWSDMAATSPAKRSATASARAAFGSHLEPR